MKSTSSKGRSPWKVKKTGGSRAGGGIVIPKGAILVNQGLKKVKLEEDYVDRKPELPVSMKIEQDADSRTITSEEVSGEQPITEEYVVTKVEVDITNIPMSSEVTPAPRGEGGLAHDSLSSCPTEVIESLKYTLNKLSLLVEKQNEEIKKQNEAFEKQNEAFEKQNEAIMEQNEAIKKQNEEIGVMKSSIRNIELSLANYFKSGEKEENGRGHGNHENDDESLENNSESTSEDSLLLGRPSASHSVKSGVFPDNSKEVDHHTSSVANLSGTSSSSGSDTKIPDVSPNQSTSASRKTTSTAGNGHRTNNDDLNRTYLSIFSKLKKKLPRNEEQKNGEKNSVKKTCNLNEFVQCPKCVKSFKSNTRMRAHLKRFHHAVPIKCHLCTKAFLENSYLTKHIRACHQGILYKCPICSREFSQLFSLRRHSDLVHKEDLSTKQCGICGVHVWNTELSLRDHMIHKHKKSSSEVGVFGCQLCPKFFPRIVDFHHHLSQSHGITAETEAGK